MNTTDREEQIKDMLKRLAESTGVYAIAFASDAINETETKLRTDTLIHDYTERLFALFDSELKKQREESVHTLYKCRDTVIADLLEGGQSISTETLTTILNLANEYRKIVESELEGKTVEKAPSITDEKI